MLTSTRRRLAAAALVLLAPLPAACGFGYQTDKVYQPGVGTNNQSTSVDILASVVVSAEDGSGTYIGTLVNKNQDKAITLTGITGPSDAEVTLTKPVEVPAGGLVNLADETPISVSGEGVTYGANLSMTFTFDDGASAKVAVPVVGRDREYASIGPSPSASPSESASPSSEPSSESSSSESPSESASPSSTATP